MRARDVFKRWAGLLSQGREQAPAGGEAPPLQSRRRARAAGDRASLWTEEPETCECCGRRLLTGELPALMQRGEEQLLVCPICVMQLAAAGYRSWATAAPSEAPPQLEREAA
jgi:hypothetical protein